MEDLPVTVITELGGSESENLSVSSVEAELSERDKEQLIAQTIVFSFLQRKLMGMSLNNCLIPGIGISSRYLTVCFYDSKNDVLLESCCLEVFAGTTTLTYSVILFLWPTLNYRLFCTGITDEMKNYKADFFKRVDDHLYIYKNEVTKHVHKQEDLSDNDSWANNPGKRCKTKDPNVKYSSYQSYSE